MMAIGMTAVFAILALVVLGGSFLIKFVNRFYPEPVLVNARPTGNTQNEKNKIAAIMAAVEVSTQGKGRVASIRKVD